RRRHTRCYRDWSSDVCSSDLTARAPRQGVDALCGLPVARLYYHVAHVEEKSLDVMRRDPAVGARAASHGIRLRAERAQRHCGSRSEERRVGKGWTPWLASECE